MPHNINGLPSDLLNSSKEGLRRLKVEATVVDGELEGNALIKKEFTYNPDDTINTITETNLDTGVITIKTFEYLNGKLSKITPVIQA